MIFRFNGGFAASHGSSVMSHESWGFIVDAFFGGAADKLFADEFGS